MTKYTAKDYIVDWYKSIPAQIDETLKGYRISAIEKLLENENQTLWFDIVRLHRKLKLADEENKNEFVEAFRQFDSGFPLLKNDNIVQALAGITLCFLLESEPSGFIDEICLALVNTALHNNTNLVVDLPLNDYINDYLSRTDERISSGDDKIDENFLFELDEKYENEEVEWTNEEQNTILKTIISLNKSNKFLSEESNILWWMFGSYSNSANNSFKTIGLNKMIPFAASDLAELTVFKTRINSARQLLNKALLISNDDKPLKNLTFFDILKELTDDERNILLTNTDKISDLTPLLFSILRSKDNVITDDWCDIFKKSTNINLKTKLNPVIFSYQLYSEYIFLKELSS